MIVRSYVSADIQQLTFHLLGLLWELFHLRAHQKKKKNYNNHQVASRLILASVDGDYE